MLQRSTLPPPPPLAELTEHALFVDFDGTLVKIAEGPDKIDVAKDLGSRLARLAARLGQRLAVVTGRSLENLESFLDTADFYRAGSHGAHVVAPNGAMLREAQALPDEVIATLKRFAAERGLLYERKTHGGAIHYRAEPSQKRAVQDIAASVASEHGLSAKHGKCVVELVWPGADKGGAVRLLAERAPFAGARPVFIGDDVTDEDGMAAAAALGGFGIAVGERPSDNAIYHLNSVKDVHAWLKL
ncbi:trehalose-phosphatase [Erythrobacter litoralis]|uniref:Trehalose 6-phosphate phosphatase n=1 Tax=Erythrobacter litoralis (strain HTCC2594) TaxID=314225 RepID=Q2NBB3_ERYLH|nr:trehalose-phosphatase [Erythrobacter litoralis]ABC63028.1 Trehalose-phosphatase [Erythrobacter litoralis HTCC2594]